MTVIAKEKYMKKQKTKNKSDLSRLTLLLLVAGFLGLAPVSAADAPQPEPIVLLTAETGVVLEWRAPAFTQRQATGGDGRSYVALDAPGWTESGAPGWPQLPVASALLVAPPVGDVTLQVQVLERSRVSLSHPVLPAPKMALADDPSAGLESVWARSEFAYSTRPPRSPRPQESVHQWVTLEEAGWMRGRRLVRVIFSPLRFDPAGTALDVARHVRVTLRFSGKENRFFPENLVSRNPPDPFTPILERIVLNPAQAAQFALPERTVSAPASTLADPPGGADYLIIAPAAFTSAVNPLASHRAAEGLRVHSVTVEEIYAEYAGAHQEAIKSYIAHAYASWTPPALSYVLLVGDGTEDGSGVQHVPPYMITDPWGYEADGVAADNRYVTMDGPDDQIADIFIGRLPVNSVAEANTVVQKILDYEQNPPQYPWNERVLFIAGHENQANGEEFHDTSDWLYNSLPSGFSGRRVYFCTQGCTQPYKYDDMTMAHDVALGALNGGGLIATFEGHSSDSQWDYDPVTYAPLFHVNDDVPDLHNGGALPVFVEATCYSSRFAYPNNETLDESLLRLAGGGAVATWGNTTLGLDSGHESLRERFFYATLENSVTELGPAIGYAKLGLDSKNLCLHDTFTLLGDPAMDLNLTVVPWTDELFLPLVMRGG
ncbi:MAG: hypothetical protein B6I35_04320 [Anaerolineaceae bacterium 4572_32.2]|nr:MAG: hypothetical protein B6I35_04320 [Anaerolineaceae bacterium 4572_32.2]